MMDLAILDNDLMIKVCGYKLVDKALRFLDTTCLPPAALGATRFIVPKQIARTKQISDKSAATIEFQRMEQALRFIEPTDDEIALAAEFETFAQDNDLRLDGGESLILAVLLQRSAKLMMTGDKRAIDAIEVAFHCDRFDCERQGFIACFEQLTLALLREQLAAAELREHIANEPNIDKALSICFSIASLTFEPSNAIAGLLSYIHHTRSKAPTVLCPTDDLSVIS